MTEESNGVTLDWLLDDLIDRVDGASRAVLLSSDGLLMAHSSSLSRTDAEHLSAVGSAYQSLSRGTGMHFGGGDVRQTVVEMADAYLLVISAGRGACLAVLTDSGADLGLIAYEMNLMVRKVGLHLSAQPRDRGEPSPAAAS